MTFDCLGVSIANTFTHDAIGNTLTKGDLTLTYNKQGRLKSASKTGMNAEYVYNFQGQRVSKQVDGGTTHFIYDLNGQLIAEADSNGAITKEYAYLNGQRLSVFENGATYFVHTDHLGTPIALSDSTGTVQWKAHYTPFGKAIVEVNNLAQNIRFPGQYFDSESGLHYNYFRDYDPEIGRYIQSDPIGLNGGINTYGYGYQNPIMNTDPLGLCVGFCSRGATALRPNPGRAIAPRSSPIPGYEIAPGLPSVYPQPQTSIDFSLPPTPMDVLRDWFWWYLTQDEAEECPVAHDTDFIPGKPETQGKGHPLSEGEAADIVRNGGDVVARNEREARRIARLAGDGHSEPIHHNPHGSGQRPHYHPTIGGVKGGGHVLY